ncbi:MAG: hypothetical protein HPY78_03345 [Brevinematales bacterium]|nr:hypothetical protein [Brevinematales bacterium]
MRFESFEKGMKNILGYSFPIQAEVVKGYEEMGSFYADCNQIHLDGSKTSIFIPKVSVPKIWGKLLPGTIVTIGFYEGMKSFPFVLNVLGNKTFGNIDLIATLETLIDILIALKTVGSPTNHVISPDDVAKLLEFKTLTLQRLR